MDKILTVKEVAEILKVKPITVREMFREHRLRAFKLGKAWRTTEAMLDEDIAAMARGKSSASHSQPDPAAPTDEAHGRSRGPAPGERRSATTEAQTDTFEDPQQSLF